MSVLAKLIGEEEFVETLRSMAECPVCISVPRYVQKCHERCNIPTSTKLQGRQVLPVPKQPQHLRELLQETGAAAATATRRSWRRRRYVVKTYGTSTWHGRAPVPARQQDQEPSPAMPAVPRQVPGTSNEEQDAGEAHRRGPVRVSVQVLKKIKKCSVFYFLLRICSFSKNGCKVKNVDDKLKVHERECKFRDVQCPKCRGIISVTKMGKKVFFNK